MNRVCYNLNPITVGICNEGNVVHFSVLQLLDKGDAFLLKTFASLFNVIYSDTNVPKSFSWFLIATGIPLELRVGFRAVIAELKKLGLRSRKSYARCECLLSQFQDTRDAESKLLLLFFAFGYFVNVGEEVQSKTSSFVHRLGYKSCKIKVIYLEIIAGNIFDIQESLTYFIPSTSW